MKLVYPVRRLLRADGTTLDLAGPVSMTQIERLIGADSCDVVVLADRVHVIIVDDTGHEKRLPVNRAATLLYWERCGGENDWFIAGDVVIVPDRDFA